MRLRQVQSFALYCSALHCIVLNCIALHCIVVHCKYSLHWQLLWIITLVQLHDNELGSIKSRAPGELGSDEMGWEAYKHLDQYSALQSANTWASSSLENAKHNTHTHTHKYLCMSIWRYLKRFIHPTSRSPSTMFGLGQTKGISPKCWPDTGSKSDIGLKPATGSKHQNTFFLLKKRNQLKSPFSNIPWETLAY